MSGFGPRPRLLIPALAALAALAALLAAAPAAADYEQTGHFATEPVLEGQKIVNADSAAINVEGTGGVEPGSLYVSAGTAQTTILRYSPAGQLKEAWGWHTIASGPDLPNQVSSLEVSATSGAYELRVGTGKARAEFTKESKLVNGVRVEVGAFHAGDAVDAANSLPFAEGSGNLNAGSKTVSSVAESGGLFELRWMQGMAIFGPGIPAGTTVTAVSEAAKTLTLSQAATATRTGAALRGRATIAAVDAGTLEVSLPSESTTSKDFAGWVEASISATETTASIPFDASAAAVEASLLALPAFEAGDLTVSGGPGDYEITFEGSYAGSPVELTATESTLEGGVPSSEATVTTTTAASTPGFQRCRLYIGDRCTDERREYRDEDVGAFLQPQGVAVDQTTGYVYVLNSAGRLSGAERTHNLIEVFSADGSEVIARFGDAAASASTPTTEEPATMHGIGSAKRSIAVAEDGTVYVGDGGAPARVMCFRPVSAGDYGTYEYCGSSHDVTGVTSPEHLSLDDAGHLYVAGEKLVEERAVAEAGAPVLCSAVPTGRIFAMAVDPHSGEVFYFDGSPAGQKVHLLKQCDPETGTFEDAQAPIAVSPSTKYIRALAFNPDLSWGAGRPAGVLYGTDIESHEIEGVKYHGLGYIFAQANTHPPEVLAESASDARTTSVTLHAEIDPYGHVTRYAFQYESEAQYAANPPGERFLGASEAPAAGGQIAAGGARQVAVALTGLSPDTAYRFRAVASSICDEETGEPCPVEGAALPFNTYPLYPVGLPDHRAYELVSPAQKHGGEVIPADPGVSSCYHCKPSTFGIASYPIQSAPDGEALAYLGQPFSLFEGAVEYDSYVSRRTAAGWQTSALIPALPLNVSQLAFDAPLAHGLLRTGSGNGLEIQDTADPGSTTPLVTEGNHRNASELVLSYAGHSADFSRHFFSANDALTKASPFAPEPPDPGKTKNDLYEWHEGKLALVNVAPDNSAVIEGAEFASRSPDVNVISADGRRVYFEASGRLYVREDAKVTREVTEPGKFLTASPDGLEVLLSNGCLYSLASETCTDLTQGMGGFEGIAGQSADLSHIYFVDSQALPGAGENDAGQVAETGKHNLYSWTDGEARFVAQLLGAGATPDTQNWAANPGERTAEASLNGRYLAFSSNASLTGYDNVGPCARNLGKVIGEVPCAEVFLYDSGTGRLSCASCNPTGEAPPGPSTLRRIAGGSRLPQPRYLTDEGRLYFDSPDSLSARDTNEGVEDVYEYEAKGAGQAGTCEREAGCVFLISAGTGMDDSNLIAVDESGKNVFFDTRDQLSLRDKDQLLDVYDAREGGGISAETEVARVECQGESCQPPAQAPNDPTPASSAFEGLGNVREGKVKRHGKKHKRHARKHGKKGRNAKRAAQRNHGGAK